MKEGTDFYPAQSDNFFVGNAFPTCGINFTAQEIMGQTEANVSERGARGLRSPRPRARPCRLFVMQGVSKRYGGVRALQDADLAIEAGRIHAVLGENGAGKSTLIKIMAGVVAPDEGRMLLDGEPVVVRLAGRGQRGRHRLHLPGAVADPRSFGGRQHRDQQPAAPLRPDRPPRAAPHGRGGAGARRRRGHPSAGAGQGPVAVAAADGRDRQGARAQAAHPDPRRGHVGADRRRRDEDLRAS